MSRRPSRLIVHLKLSMASSATSGQLAVLWMQPEPSFRLLSPLASNITTPPSLSRTCKYLESSFQMLPPLKEYLSLFLALWYICHCWTYYGFLKEDHLVLFFFLLTNLFPPSNSSPKRPQQVPPVCSSARVYRNKVHFHHWQAKWSQQWWQLRKN